MIVIRHFEEKVDWLFARGKIMGTSHLCVGQEAIAVGACAALRTEDYITSNHRGHGHFIAKGGDPKKIMAEIFGKATGYCKGKGGTQHMCCTEVGHLGSNGITGGQIPIATGIAFAIKYNRESKVVICFLGDGATNQGIFHEALNMAALWKLPVVYVCENNRYAMSTPVQEGLSVEHIAERAAGYGMPGLIVDGNDPLAIKETVVRAVELAREGKGPSLVEAKTYRLLGHSKSDPRQYRTKEEEKAAWKNEPIRRFVDFLKKQKAIGDDELKKIEADVQAEIEAAVEYAENSPLPGLEVAFEDIFVYSNEAAQ
ncbi:thiamine pyrophosphate-dependent dehydrogenase E1 component subunit alpha [Candidatus Saganbacteria bacterium]|nr:thiamine pyrophosphate-dependent dehydrogenase E1 component subunit alpha [Candidatus Gottesmanbacteria bacterium]MBI5701734.1 thiamine pyrophosphate-dependent dehydrogenase E1 component subunit alpha [Candidatus Saganbacteria bacterium]